MVQRWAMHTPLCPGGGGKASPLPQHCTFLAHEEATLPCVSCCDGHRGRHRCHCHCRCCSHCNWCCHLHCHFNRRCCCPLPPPLAIAIAVSADNLHCHLHYHHRTIAIAVGHHRCRCHQPLQLLSPSAIAIAVAVGHRCCLCHRPLPSLSPFEQFKQIMLTLFYLIWTVSGALIAADDWPEVRWQWALAITIIGRQAASNEWLVGVSGWWQGSSRVETLPAHWLAMGGVVLLCCWDASHWEMAFVMMCWMW